MSQTFPLSFPSEYIFVTSTEDGVLWETEMKSLYNWSVMTGFPFDFVCYILTPPPSLSSGECFLLRICVCAAVWVCLLVSSVAWWDGEIDESFVGLLTSPLHSNLSSCGFYNEWLDCHPWRTTNRDWRWFTENPEELNLNCLGSPPPYDLFLAACSLRPQLMMQPEPAARRQEAETSMS